MSRVIIIAAVVAVAALGVGVTVGSTSGSTAAPPRPTTATAQGETWDQRMCEEATKRMRVKHPDMYIAGCNHGQSSIGISATP